MAEPRVLAPSDCAKQIGCHVRVGGRVLALDGAQLVLTDALGSVHVQLSEPSALRIGDFAVIDGCVAGSGNLADAILVEIHVAPAPSGDGDFARYTWQGVGARLKQRSHALTAIREYFAASEFLEIDAPMLVPAPGLDSFVVPVACGTDYLCTSPEFQLKRLVAGGLPRIYCLAHVARAEEAGPWHEREFALLEWYRVFAPADALRADAEKVVQTVAQRLVGAQRISRADGRSIDLKSPFLRMTVRDAFQNFAGVSDAADLAATDEATYFQLLVDRVEPALSELEQPVFLEAYPASQAALARLSPEDPSVADRIELFLGGTELANGFVELTDAAEQRRRFDAELKRRRQEGAGGELPLDERFLNALSAGMPPCAGMALGVDRLIALCLSQSAIQPVLPFPRDWL